MNPEIAATVEAIQRCRPLLGRDIATILAEAPPLTEEVELSSARSGALTVRLAGRYVHSRFDPLREAHQRLERFLQDSKERALVTLGFGLGYLQEILGVNRSRTVITVIFSPELLRLALVHRGAAWWCTYGPDRLVPAWNVRELPLLLQELELRDPHVMGLDGITASWPERTQEVETVLKEVQQRHVINRNTLRRFGQLWVRNGIRNLALTGNLPGIDELAGTMGTVPAVVCGAGPTLDGLRRVMESLARQNLIIAVDTAISVLQRWGVNPDVAVVSDPQYWNSRHLDRVVAHGTVLIAEPATHPRVFRLWNGAVRVSASLFPLGSFFDRHSGRHLKLGAGGSVATSAWDLARILGSNDIAMAGVDLGFPGNQTHCEDSFFENRLRHYATRLAPAEHGLVRYLHGALPSPVPAAGGGTVLSDKRMELYRAWFAEQNRQFPGVSTVLLSGESSAIPGISVETPEERLRRLHDRDNLQLHHFREALAAQTALPAVGKITVLHQLEDALQEIAGVVTEGIALCDTMADSPDPQLHLLDAVDQRIGRLESRDLAAFLATDALDAEIQRSATTVSEAIGQARRLYEAVERSCTYHINYIHRFF